MRYLTIDTEGEMLTIDGLIHRLEMNLVAAILHTHHADILPIEELGVAFWATLAYSLLEAEAIVGLGDYAIKALVGSDFVVLLKGAGKVDGLVGFLLHSRWVLAVDKM